MSDPLERWVMLGDDEQNWMLDAVEYDREQVEADKLEHANRLAALPGEADGPDLDCPDCGLEDCCC